MTRLAIIYRHAGAETVVRHADSTKDVVIVEHAMSNFGPAHNIIKIDICSIDTTHFNESSLEIWLKTTQRLTK